MPLWRTVRHRTPSAGANQPRDRPMIRAAIPALLLLLLSSLSARAQLARSGDLTAHLDSLIGALPSELDGNQYSAPFGDDTLRWRAAVGALHAGDAARADSFAAHFGYRAVVWTDGGVGHLLLERDDGASGPHWGILVHAAAAARPKLVVQAPHPVKDANTGRQAVRIHTTALPGWTMIAGTSRCNASAYSSCDGTTSICSGASEPYRISDQAHVVDGSFQLALDTLFAAEPELIVLQPHGFARGDADPHIILSNGTTHAPSGTDWTLALRSALTTLADTLTFKVGHLDDWDRLLGTTNTQGRLINGSAAPCREYATAATGRFVHMEQSYPGLRDGEEGWDLVARGVAAAFPAESQSAPETEGPLPGSFALRTSPNPFNGVLDVRLELARDERVEVTVWNVAGRRAALLAQGRMARGVHRMQWRPGGLPSGTYLVRVQAAGETLVRKVTYLK